MFFHLHMSVLLKISFTENSDYFLRADDTKSIHLQMNLKDDYVLQSMQQKLK